MGHFQFWLRGHRTLKIFYTYKLTRPDKKDPFDSELDQPFWIGKGKKDRIYSHRKEAKKCFKNPSLQRDIRINIIIKLWNLGLDFIEEKICKKISEEEAFEMEILAISKYGRINNNTGCLANLTDGGEGCAGMVFPEESKQKSSNSMKGKYDGENNPFYGCTHTEEIKEYLRIKQTGNLASTETKEKMRETRLRLISEGVGVGENHPLYGTHPSEETLLRMSEGQKNRQPPAKETLDKMSAIRTEWWETHRSEYSGENHWAWGKTLPEEHRQKIRDNHADMSGENNSFYNKTHTAETKQHMKDIWKLRKLLKLTILMYFGIKLKYGLSISTEHSKA